VPAQRLNDSVLGALERPTLAWLAQRLPIWVTPDHLTGLGLAGALAAAAGYVASHWSLQWLWLACAGLALNWFGDSLDGTLARLRCRQRPRYGFFVDHTSDLFAQLAIFLALGVSPCARFEIACLGLIAFLVAFVYSLICVEVRDTLRITYFRFGPTEIRALLIAGNLITLGWGVVDVSQWIAPWARFGPVTIYEIVILVLFVTMVPGLVLLALRERRILAFEDPPPPLAAVRTASRPSPSAVGIRPTRH
jgi:archaetidylinositol phosphate synthase